MRLPSPPAWLRHPILRHPVTVRVVLVAALIFAGSRAVAPEVFGFRSGDLTIRLTPDVPGGATILELGPFGELSWHTHKGPLNVEASFQLSRQAAELPPVDQLRDLRVAFVLRKIPWILAFGLILGAIVVQGHERHRWRNTGFATAGFALFVALVVGVSALTFDPASLASPRYRGPIRDAPRVLQLLKEVQDDFAGVRRNINKVVAGLQRIHAQIVAQSNVPQGPAIRLLVISDLHNNPLGLLIADELREQFAIDGVLDAGDFTDRGTQLEGELFSRFASIGVPHIITPGNHEDVAATRRVRNLPGVEILESGGEDLADVRGVTILGDADPNSTSIESDPRNETARTQVPLRCDALAGRLVEERPSVLMVHDPKMGECAARLAEAQQIPLVFVWGHTHRQAYEQRGSVVALSAGTSGANGIKSPVPSGYGFALLEFDSESRRLASVCLFVFDGPQALRQAACHLSPAGGATTGPAGSPAPSVTPPAQ